MSTLYLTQHGTEMTKDGGKLVLKCNDEVRYIPSSYAESVVVMANVGISYAAVREILKCGGSIVYLEKDGSLLGELGNTGTGKRNRLRQMETYLDEGRRFEIASSIVQKKIAAQRDLLSTKNKSMESDVLRKAAAKLGALVNVARKQDSVQKLMGVEGLASKTYFDTFGMLLSGSEFKWVGRRRPANDPINAMLNFGYSLLEKDIRRFINVSGLDGSIGFLHAMDLRKESLVYDLMEVFRPGVVDKLVMRCVNWGMFREKDFDLVDGKFWFKDDARRKFIAEYEKYVGAFDDIEGTQREKMCLEVKNIIGLLQQGSNRW